MIPRAIYNDPIEELLLREEGVAGKKRKPNDACLKPLQSITTAQPTGKTRGGQEDEEATGSFDNLSEPARDQHAQGRTVVLTDWGIDILNFNFIAPIPPLPKTRIACPTDRPVYNPARHKALPPVFPRTSRSATSKNVLGVVPPGVAREAHLEVQKMRAERDGYLQMHVLRYNRPVRKPTAPRKAAVGGTAHNVAEGRMVASPLGVGSVATGTLPALKESGEERRGSGGEVELPALDAKVPSRIALVATSSPVSSTTTASPSNELTPSVSSHRESITQHVPLPSKPSVSSLSRGLQPSHGVAGTEELSRSSPTSSRESIQNPEEKEHERAQLALEAQKLYASWGRESTTDNGVPAEGGANAKPVDDTGDGVAVAGKSAQSPASAKSPGPVSPNKQAQAAPGGATSPAESPGQALSLKSPSSLKSPAASENALRTPAASTSSSSPNNETRAPSSPQKPDETQANAIPTQPPTASHPTVVDSAMPVGAPNEDEKSSAESSSIQKARKVGTRVLPVSVSAVDLHKRQAQQTAPTASESANEETLGKTNSSADVTEDSTKAPKKEAEALNPVVRKLPPNAARFLNAMDVQALRGPSPAPTPP
ncbi:hypothetical protein HK104_004825, partial [Borealophlyctis nickersoniae]